MGKAPESTQIVKGYYVLKYKLTKWGTGRIPYYFFFEPNENSLISWHANMEEFNETNRQYQQLADQFRITNEVNNANNAERLNCTSTKYGNSVYTNCR